MRFVTQALVKGSRSVFEFKFLWTKSSLTIINGPGNNNYSWVYMQKNARDQKQSSGRYLPTKSLSKS